jgi:hypothetical protein
VGTGANLLRPSLLAEVAKHNISISPLAILDAGPPGLQVLAVSPTMLQGLPNSYGKAVSIPNTAATVAICISVLTVFGMRWRNLMRGTAGIKCLRRDETIKDEKLVGVSSVERS